MAEWKQQKPVDNSRDELIESVIQIKRTSKKTKGGNRLGFTCLAVVGDGKGRVGLGLGKAPIVVAAVQKAHRLARKKMVSFPLVSGAQTIPHELELHYGASHMLFKPAPPGTGVRASTAVRSVLEAGGVKNIVVKILGTDNIKGNVDTTFRALLALRDPRHRVKARLTPVNANKKVVAKSAKPKKREVD